MLLHLRHHHPPTHSQAGRAPQSSPAAACRCPTSAARLAARAAPPTRSGHTAAWRTSSLPSPSAGSQAVCASTSRPLQASTTATCLQPTRVGAGEWGTGMELGQLVTCLTPDPQLRNRQSLASSLACAPSTQVPTPAPRWRQIVAARARRAARSCTKFPATRPCNAPAATVTSSATMTAAAVPTRAAAAVAQGSRPHLASAPPTRATVARLARAAASSRARQLRACSAARAGMKQAGGATAPTPLTPAAAATTPGMSAARLAAAAAAKPRTRTSCVCRAQTSVRLMWQPTPASTGRAEERLTLVALSRLGPCAGGWRRGV